MLVFNATRVFRMRGVDRPFSYLMKNGFTRTTTGILTNNNVFSIKVKYLGELCRLLNCTPNDFFEWRDDGSQPVVETHALNQLRREKKIELDKLINDLPLEKMSRVEDFINELKNQ